MLKMENNEILEYEKDEKYFMLADRVATGHIFAFVTGEMSTSEPKTAEDGKTYMSTCVDSIELYLDEMLYAKGQKNRFSSGQYGAFAHFEIEDGGTHKFEECVRYSVSNTSFSRVGDPVPVNKSKPSVFKRYHVATSLKGTAVWMREYNSLEEFRKAICLSRDEIMKLL